MWLAALLAGWATAGAVAGELGLGDPAPKLAVKEFLKGDPIAKLEKGKTYVVEFWATWCPPCRTSIPHLTELQKRYRDVTFLGVSILENDAKDVKPFVENMGEKMGYRVARDDVPEGGKPDEGAMAKSWMQAAGQEGIPTAFIVNGDGKIAWIGHPMEMDKPLGDIVAGKWDIERQRKLIALGKKLTQASKSGNFKQVLKLIDEAIALDPEMEARLGLGKYQILVVKGGDPEKAHQYGKQLMDKRLKDDPKGLITLAWITVGTQGAEKPDAKLLQLALAAAQRADELSQGKEAGIADILAKAYFDNGKPAKAVECQERAIKLAKGTPLENDKELEKRLEDYKKALEKSGGKR
jgi:thiol-disulfide isomerase/thioredoxin